MSPEPARALLAELIGWSFATEIDPSADLVQSGVNSGDLVRLALLVEERYGVELSSDDMAALRSLDGLESLLERLDSKDAREMTSDWR